MKNKITAIMIKPIIEHTIITVIIELEIYLGKTA
jgi:hypothetical protein